MDQRSDEWYEARLGKVTASRLCDVMRTTKSGYSASRTNYIMQLLCERLSGKQDDSFINNAMQRGIELESEAIAIYESQKGLFVDACGFIDHPSITGFGASPDGLVDADGLVEIKCPNTATHIEFIKTGKPKREYILQMHGQMMCTGRKWCDFVSYDNRLSGLELYQVRVKRDDSLVAEIEESVKKFLEELETEVETILKLKERF